MDQNRTDQKKQKLGSRGPYNPSQKKEQEEKEKTDRRDITEGIVSGTELKLLSNEFRLWKKS